MSTYSGILQRAIVPPSTAHCEGVGHMSPPAVASVGSRQHESVVVNASIKLIPGRSVLRRPNPLFDAPDATLSPLNDLVLEGAHVSSVSSAGIDRPPVGAMGPTSPCGRSGPGTMTMSPLAGRSDGVPPPGAISSRRAAVAQSEAEGLLSSYLPTQAVLRHSHEFRHGRLEPPRAHPTSVRQCRM
jgi:hypothetical protein